VRGAGARAWDLARERGGAGFDVRVRGRVTGSNREGRGVDGRGGEDPTKPPGEEEGVVDVVNEFYILGKFAFCFWD
jgi:hypothetical protein